MKKLLLSTSAAALLGLSPAAADPTFMLGGTFTFGAGQGTQFGISARVISDNRPDQGVLGAGVTFYPGDGEFGFDVFAGYTFDEGVFGVGYDFAQRQPLVSLGYANMRDEAPPPVSCQPQPPVQPPPPPPVSCLPQPPVQSPPPPP
jgi:opacity protein-like surface antigen